MRGLRSFNNSACKRVLNPLEAGYLRLRVAVVNRSTVIKFEVKAVVESSKGRYSQVDEYNNSRI